MVYWTEKEKLAKYFAIAAHEAVGQKRKYTGERYWRHCESVARMVKEAGGSEDMVCAATPEESHILWQKWKLTEIDRVRAEYENERYVHEGVLLSLNTAKENLTNDIESGRITPRLSWKRE